MLFVGLDRGPAWYSHKFSIGIKKQHHNIKMNLYNVHKPWHFGEVKMDSRNDEYISAAYFKNSISPVQLAMVVTSVLHYS